LTDHKGTARKKNYLWAAWSSFGQFTRWMDLTNVALVMWSWQLWECGIDNMDLRIGQCEFCHLAKWT
jgi:hypothetical protein